MSLLSGRTISINNKDWVYFAGTSYLGIPHHPQFIGFVREGLSLFGAHYGGSRHSNIQLSVFEQVESHMAQWLGVESALLTSSGTLAGQLVAQYLKEKYHLIYAPNTHTALRTQRSTIQTDSILEQVLSSPHRKIAILTNSVDPLQLQPADWSWIQSLPSNREIILVVDDSHGIGVLGSRKGRGIVDYFKAHVSQRFVVLGSMAKALGIPAGFIAGDQAMIDKLYRHPLLIGSSPPPAPYLYAFLNASDLYISQKSKLLDNLNHFTHQSDYAHKFRYLPNYPVYYCPDNALFDQLYDEEILASSFSYPTPADAAITRIVINAAHTKEDINLLVTITNQFFNS